MSQTGLVLDPLVSSPPTLNGKHFFTATVTTSTNGNLSVGAADRNTAGTAFTTWLTEQDGEPWAENGTANKTYQITSVSTASQEITVQVSGGGLATPYLIYGKVIGWNGDEIVLNGYTDPAMTQPIPGPGSSFVITSYNVTFPPGPDQNSANKSTTSTPFNLTTTDVPSCFAEGTAVMTPTGPRPVEMVVAGDAVLTASGACKAVVWAGSTTMHCDRHPQPGRVMPVQIQAGAFGPGLPVRDLVLSPEHAVFAEDVLVPVHCLVNGTTIRQLPAGRIRYYHIELAEHDVLLAEGLPAESYLETGNRIAMDRSAQAA